GGTPSELPPALRGPSPPLSASPSFSARRLAPGGAAGPTVGERGLRFRLHSPRGLERVAAVPLVCMLHGCTPDAAGFAAVTRMNEAADRHGFVVVYPEQDRGQNPQACWNWFLSEHQARGAGEPAAIA